MKRILPALFAITFGLLLTAAESKAAGSWGCNVIENTNSQGQLNNFYAFPTTPHLTQLKTKYFKYDVSFWSYPLTGEEGYVISFDISDPNDPHHIATGEITARPSTYKYPSLAGMRLDTSDHPEMIFITCSDSSRIIDKKP